jgi:hypothetical protein
MTGRTGGAEQPGWTWMAETIALSAGLAWASGCGSIWWFFSLVR